jgi:hypothetical protein
MKKLFIYLTCFIIVLNFSCKENNLESQPEEQYVKILLKYNYKDELNTFDNYLIKDLVLNGQIKVNFWLTKEEQIKIQSMVCETNFF